MKMHRYKKWKTYLPLLFLYLNFQTKSSIAIQFQSTPFFTNPQSTVLKTESSLINPGQVFGFCSRIAHKNTDDVCNFYIETTKNINSQEHFHNCAFILKPSQTTGTKRLIALDDDKAILLVTNKFTSITILRFSDCSTVPVIIENTPSYVRYANVYAPNNSTFDLVVYGQNNFCVGRGACRYIIKYDGKVASGDQRRWISGNDINFKAVLHSETKGRLVVDTVGRQARVKKIDDYGMVEVLKVYTTDESEKGLRSKVSASATNNFLSICFLVNSLVTCSQFNSDAVIQFDTTFHLHTHVKFHSSKIHNLPHGGMLLLIFECFSDFVHCNRMQGDFTVYKIDASGRKTGSFRITQLQCIDDKTHDNIHFFINDQNEMCLSLMCDKLLQNDQVSLDLVCFKNEDFTS